MLKSNWGLILTIGVSLAVSGLLYISLRPERPNLPTYKYSRGDPGGYYPGGRRCQPEVLASIRDSGEGARERQRCADEVEQHRLQSNDLIQQTRAANAAESQVWLAYHVGWLALYGTIGGLLTLVAAAAAAIYARRAAIHSGEAVIESQKMLHSGRAWMGALGPNIGKMLNEQGDVTHIAIGVPFKNVGNSPALKCAGSIYARKFPPGTNVDSVTFDEPLEDRDEKISVTAPSAQFQTGPVIIPIDDCVKIASGEIIVLFRSFVTYYDVYSNELRWTEVTFQAMPHVHPNTIAVNDGISPFTFSTVTKHQTAN